MKVPDSTRAALAWSRMPRVTLHRFWEAVTRVQGWRALIGSDPSLLEPVFRSHEIAFAVTRPFEVDILPELAAARRAGARILTPFEGPYPRLLREIPDAPLVLYARGRVERLELPAVGIVGARNATHYGHEVAETIARDLSASGVCVVSGMARGIDAAAHTAAQSGAGGTVGVLGCGIDIVYPAENRHLFHKIEADNLLLTEFPPGTEPRAAYFPTRNRIIAGMSAGVVVVEAAEKSGSLITARLAADFGREVFAVPGSIRSETSRGCHALLRDGAILCRGAEDILSEIFPAVGIARTAEPPPEALPPDQSRVYDEISRGEGSSADDLAERLDLPAADLMVILFELEARGYIRALPGSLYAVVRSTG